MSSHSRARAALPLLGLPPKYNTAALILIASALLLRARLVPSAIPSLALGPKLNKEELAQVEQQLYVDIGDGNGSKELLVPFRGRVSKVAIMPTPPEVFTKTAAQFPPLPANYKPSVNKAFFRQLSALLKIALRGQHTLLALHTFFLLLRTGLSVIVARLDGLIARNLVSADLKGFIRGMGLWLLLAVPSSYTNAMLRHLQNKIALGMRSRLSRYTHDLYLSADGNKRYYRLGLPGPGNLDGIDQYVTADVAGFCEAASALYGNLTKPTLDMFIFTAQLARSLGRTGTILLFANYFLTARILRAVTPAFGRLAAVEARLEGEYRMGVGRVGREAEEVAFYGGGERELQILERAYERLSGHAAAIGKIRTAYEWTEDYVVKYMWSAAGYCLIGLPVLTEKTRDVGVGPQDEEELSRAVDDAVAARTESKYSYVSSRRLLMSLADAGGRLMYAYKDLLQLAGLTSRMYGLVAALHGAKAPEQAGTGDAIVLKGVDIVAPGEVGDVLVRNLNLKVERGEHLMIAGPNGVGKTAIARVLAGLWDANGVIEGKGVFVVPQRAYMVVGTLRDQIVYPMTYAEHVAAGGTDDQLMEILTHVHLAYLPEREGGWNTRKEWKDVLSGGERQRMGMARLFYHRPKFAILDECTSAVSTDVEGLMYQYAKDLGITLITISHRPSLNKYHKWLLTLWGDSTGAWTHARVGTEEERMELDREIERLEMQLSQVPQWERRLKEVANDLGVSVKF
ncbi:ATP-binding cassette sub-family D protein [Ceratobasidium theobromae]|uniref:ATP-binding cassette sub-family D protein n=1 Tax=Ceratobasidium theobromae TaxID=1582974 RepID=A0A5N5QIE5_9AGAM|nr:ATP-binding cassette sub-family D protein [Ceratobasidium theobromae]